MKGARGMAMVTAIAAVVIISITAAMVLNLTLRRFEMSAFRTDRAIAGAAAEAGIRAAFAGLEGATNYTDSVNFPDVTGLANVVQAAWPDGYRVVCHDDVLPHRQNDVVVMDAEHGVFPALHMGNKHVAIEIRFENPPTVAGRPYRIRSVTRFGTEN